MWEIQLLLKVETKKEIQDFPDAVDANKPKKLKSVSGKNFLIRWQRC